MPRWPSATAFRTVRGRLVLLACLATLPAFLFVLVVAAQARGAALRQAEREVRYVVDLASREHAHQVIGAERLLHRLGQDFRGGEAAFGTLERMLPAMLSGFPQCANLGVLTPEGGLRSSVVPPAHPVDMRDNPAFRGALHAEGTVLGRYQVGPIVQRPVLLLAHALRGPGAKVEGVLFAALDLAWLDQLARQAHLPPRFALLLADGEGRVLASSEGEGPRVAAAGDFLPDLRGLLERGRGLDLRKGQDGQRRLFAAAPLEGVPDLHVAVGVPEGEVVGQANRAFTRAAIALAALTLLAVASSIAAADLSVLRDVRQLARATRLFGAGDMSVRAPVSAAPGEFQDLALAFNGMADALIQRHQEALDARDQLRALSHRLQAAREEEGARISRELHDQLGQELTALKLDLSRIRRQLGQACPPTAEGPVGEALGQMAAHLDECVESVRRIASELRPNVLDRLGLGPALEWLAREFERRTEVPCLWEGADPTSDLEPGTATALFRVTQEALTNAARHARAHLVQIGLGTEGGDLVLTIQDDGVGFPVQDGKESLGLLGMRERIRLVGGDLAVESGPRGTRVVARVPRAGRGD